MRRFAIGDIHGCSKALRTLLEVIDPQPEDELIFLGDYIDRGSDSRDVVDQIIALKNRCRVVALRGNHEIMLVAVALKGMDETVWLENGGQATVASYGGTISRIPPEHMKFYRSLKSYYETDDAIFVHAGYCHLLKMSELDEATLYWNHLPFPLPLPHNSGKRVFLGHTPQPAGNVLERDHLVCVDTYCFGGGFLTAYQVETGELIQVNSHGFQRRRRFGSFMRKFSQFSKAWNGARKAERSGNTAEGNSPLDHSSDAEPGARTLDR
ncbi:MAG: metallophosphoesterase family protein [Rubripirellula sp.]